MSTTQQVEQYDVIVVGFGAAGACAAIEAADRGARVLVLERAYGGGASTLSGGVVYAGGGTPQQIADGVEDSPENMFRYLQQEIGDAVDETTLRAFCEGSVEMISWLTQQGVSFAGGNPSYKTSYPTDDYYLYYSGNETAYPFRDIAAPAPRGHRAVAKGLGSGKAFWEALARAAERKGVTVALASEVEEILMENGEVSGVKYRTLPATAPNARKHRSLLSRGGKLGNWMPALLHRATAKAGSIWRAESQVAIARSSSVILSAGGFIFQRDWVQKYAPEFLDISPLGTPADDGSGIALGEAVGGSTGKMGNVTAWRFLSPPSALLEGVTVGENGQRIASEDLYGAAHGDVMMRQFGGRGWLICDATIHKKARKQIRSQTQSFQLLQLIPLFLFGFRKAPTIEALAKKLGIDPKGVSTTVDAYNSGITSGTGDPAHKSEKYCTPIQNGPFYGLNISAKNAVYFPVPGLTLGGLKVSGSNGLVLREDGQEIPGLYAAGRNAVGICANGYVSGLSLADCVFSGRRAGAHAAGQ